jgi:hypothetical protein
MGVVSEDLEFRNTRNGTRVITRGMADFQSVKSYFDNHNLSYFFFPKKEKPVKAVIRHLPHNTPAQDSSDGLVSLGFDIINVKLMTTTRGVPGILDRQATDIEIGVPGTSGPTSRRRRTAETAIPTAVQYRGCDRVHSSFGG